MVYGIVGPTSSGKSFVANELAKTGKYIIINADSQQIYSYLPTLSAMPDNLDHHVLYGVLDHVTDFSVAQWAAMVHKEVEHVFEMGKIPVLVGGTGMYFKALQTGIAQVPEVDVSLIKNHSLDELKKYVTHEYAAKIHDRRRLKKAAAIFLQTEKYIEEWQSGPRDFQLSNFHIYGLMPERAQIWENIETRLSANLDKMIDEVLEFNQQHGECEIDMIGYDEIVNLIKDDICVISDTKSSYSKGFVHRAQDLWSWTKPASLRDDVEKIQAIKSVGPGWDLCTLRTTKPGTALSYYSNDMYRRYKPWLTRKVTAQSPGLYTCLGRNAFCIKQLHNLIFYKTRQYAKRQSTYIRNCLKLEGCFSDPDTLLNYLLHQ